MVLLKKICGELRVLADPDRARNAQRFFKTGKGEYGYGDKFLGITVPEVRKVAKNYYVQATFKDIGLLLSSVLHEERLLALLMLVLRYKKADAAEQKKIYDFYCKNSAGVNNWDLVDLSAPYIVGAYVFDKKKDYLRELVKSKDLWQRRIAIVATLHFIRNGLFEETLRLAKVLLKDKEDLLHKATGWALREIGKKDLAALEGFLLNHYQVMPRTMLRYAIERFPEERRLFYLYG